MTDLAVAAQKYIHKGLRVFPCSIDKKPLTTHGYKEATSDVSIVGQWWQDHPSASIGVPTGGKFFVLDVDLPEGPLSLKRLEAKYGPLPETLQQETGGGGRHLFFQVPDNLSIRNSAGKLGPNLDVRGEGGYVIFPPSRHASGARYRFLNKLPIAEPPPWLVDLVALQPNRAGAEQLNAGLKPAGLYGLAAIDGESKKVAASKKGSRNDTLNKAAFSLGQLIAGGEVDKEQAVQALFDAAMSVGLSEIEARQTIESGLHAGSHEPRKAPRQVEDQVGPSSSDAVSHVMGPPLLFEEICTPEISPELLPGWLGDYAGAVAKNTQTPPAMAVMLALSSVATCTAKRFEVAPHGEGYTEPLNVWTATALPPASRKTAVIAAMTAPLSEWEGNEAERLAPQIMEVNTARKIANKRIEKLEKDAANKADPSAREETKREILQLKRDMVDELREPRLWTGDITPERLQSLLADHGERMAVLTDEGGIFEVMAGLYSDGRANLDVFLQGHAGKSVRVDRQGRTAHLQAPALSFGLAIQPAILADFGTGGKRRFRGNGTLARFLYAVPRSNIGRRDVRAFFKIPASVEARYREGLFDLLSIPAQIVNGREVARRLVLSPDALECWLAFLEAIEERQGPDGDLEGIQDWSGKLPGAALRIAGNFHLVEHGPKPPAEIEAETIARVLDLCELLIDHAKAAFSMMEADPAAADAKKILNWIVKEQLSRFRRGEVYRQFKGRFTGKTERLDKALRELQTRSMVTEANERTTGRPATVFLVNPQLLEET